MGQGRCGQLAAVAVLQWLELNLVCDRSIGLLHEPLLLASANGLLPGNAVSKIPPIDVIELEVEPRLLL